MKKKTIELITTMTTDIGPVFAQEEKLEVVEVSEGEVDVKPSQYGYYLSIDVNGKKHAVNVRGIAKDQLKDEKKFSLEIWTAIKAQEASGNRRAVAVGDKRIYAIPA